jgi:hypothetical protein
MLEQTAREAFQENQETGFGRVIRTVDPEVPGYVFWPIIFGGCDLRASGARRLLAPCGGAFSAMLGSALRQDQTYPWLRVRAGRGGSALRGQPAAVRITPIMSRDSEGPQSFRKLSRTPPRVGQGLHCDASALAQRRRTLVGSPVDCLQESRDVASRAIV